MTIYYQETDSKIIFPIPKEYKYPAKLGNETFGKKPFLSYFSPAESRLIKSALDVLRNTENQQVAVEAINILANLRETVSSFHQLSFDLSFLPPIRAFNNEDGSVLIEWIFTDFRIGFSIETNIEESGWYLVSKRKLGEISASGHIENTNIKNIIVWLLNFVISHS